MLDVCNELIPAFRIIMSASFGEIAKIMSTLKEQSIRGLLFQKSILLCHDFAQFRVGLVEED